MSVSRIRKLDIDNRGLFTGVYGYSSDDEFYIDNNLCKYYLWQELYIYLHEMGYITVFYNDKNNFFSYQLRDMEIFFRKKADTQEKRSENVPNADISIKKQRHPRCRGPLGMARPRSEQNIDTHETDENKRAIDSSTQAPVTPNNHTNQLVSPYSDIIVGGNPETGFFYCSKTSENRLFDRIFKYVDDNRSQKLVVIFTNPEETTVKDTDVVITGLRNRSAGHSKTDMPLRILSLYSAKTVSAIYQTFDKKDKFFFNQYFKNLIFPDPTIEGSNINSISDNNLFYVSRPWIDEIANVLNRRRIMEGMKGMFDKPLDTLCRNLWQDFPRRDSNGKVIITHDNKPSQIQSVSEMMGLPLKVFELSLEKIDSDGGRKKFNQLLGIDEIRCKLDAYIKAFHEYRAGRIREFSPHIALTGNPGTGKTTVARLIGQILREEGLLTNGHMVETNPGGLISSYVGDTRVKTNEICQQSRGGVLFVDEAYGLCREGDNSPSGNTSYGKEAIEALLTFMLPAGEVDSVVVFAGYPKEIEYFLDNGNPGLRRRVPYVWNIDDYSADVLYEIAMKGLQERETTEAFRTSLRMIFAYKYAMRNKNWGNAGDANKIAQTILTNYLEKGADKPLDVDSIPSDLIRVIKDISTEEENDIMRDINQLIGLSTVKTSLRNLVKKIRTQRYEMRTMLASSITLENLNFVFNGNPGTGKTTVANKLGRILYSFGILESSDVIIADVEKINHGDPAKNLIDFMDKAIGKVLLIDEAYSLINQNNTIAIDALTNALTKDEYKGKLAIVLAGYSADMDRLLESNKGLASRFPNKNKIHFEDYTSEELWQVLKLKASMNRPLSLTVSEDCHPYAVDYFNRLSRESFSNAREAENLFNQLTAARGERAYEMKLSINDPSFAVILPQDFESFGRIDPSKVKIDDGSDTLSPMDKLNKLQGIEDIREQFDKFIKDFRYANQHPQEARFRPHMAFLGNPGTGKTTVARIFGSILREERLLKNGNFIEAKAEDFISGFVGDTRPKAQAKCKEARGGIMFIDEAHQLFQKEGEHGYAKEALGVILTELESRTDTLYIFAGYTREMNEFLDKADPGLRSRIRNIFEFKDYKPDTLIDILRSHFNGKTATSKFDKNLKLVVQNIYDRRNPFTFGNARTMEAVAGEILGLYREKHNGEGPLTEECIPEKYLGLLRPITSQRESEIFSELNGMTGLAKVKETLGEIKDTAKGIQQKIIRGLMKTVPPTNLTFLFMGNPGTGKSTVARLLGKILHGYGLLDSDEVKVYTKDKLVDKYVGETQKNVTKMFDDCFGRVLFIDETYMLARDKYGIEALDQITANMTDPNYMGKMAIVMAGYTKDINDMLNANAGLNSRFRYRIIFEDYNNDELWQILEDNISNANMIIDKYRCKKYADAFFDLERRNGPNFGNVRVCNNLCETLKNKQNVRTSKDSSNLTDEECMTILPVDFPNYKDVKTDDVLDVCENCDVHEQMSNPSNSIARSYTIDCSKNNVEQRVGRVQDLERAVGLLHSEHGEGTGFIVSPIQKYILTCSHVVEHGNSFDFRMMSGKFTTKARLLWNNYEQDMALLELDALPSDVRYIEIDSEVEKEYQKLVKLILCGYHDGSAFASGVSLVEGSLTNYEKNRQWNDRAFDTIYANMSATHGCSGGPVVRSDDFKVIGMLQGGKEGGEIQLITDIHQLFRNLNIIL